LAFTDVLVVVAGGSGRSSAAGKTHLPHPLLYVEPLPNLSCTARCLSQVLRINHLTCPRPLTVMTRFQTFHERVQLNVSHRYSNRNSGQCLSLKFRHSFSFKVRETIFVLARMNTQPDYAAAWRYFRRRRIIFCAVFLGYMPGVLAIYFAVGLPLSALTEIKPDYFGLAIASCWMAAFAVTVWRVAGFSYPRCHKWFFATWWYHNPLGRKCVHCGLPKWANSEPPTSN
jgi:hypothetical protein